MKKITEIKEKVELKDLEVQSNPCQGVSNNSCEYDCCEDCKGGTSWQSSKY